MIAASMPVFAGGEITADTVLTEVVYESHTSTVTWHLDVDDNQVAMLEETEFEIQVNSWGNARQDSLHIDNDSDRAIYVDMIVSCDPDVGYELVDEAVVEANSSGQFWMHGWADGTAHTCAVTFRANSHAVSDTAVVEPFFYSCNSIPVQFWADVTDDGLAGGSVNIDYSNGLTLDSVTFNPDFGLTLLSASDTAYFVDTGHNVDTEDDNYWLFTAYFSSTGGSDVVSIGDIVLDDDGGDPITPIVNDVGWVSC